MSRFLAAATALALLATSDAAAAQGTTERASVATGGAQADAQSLNGSISADGRYVVFCSTARNLVPGDTNLHWDVFVRDRQTSVTTRVSVSSLGTEANGSSVVYPKSPISADGRYVVFSSSATNLVPADTNGKTDVFLHDRQTGSTVRVSVEATGAEANGDSVLATLSADGRFIAFESFASHLTPVAPAKLPTIYVHDRSTGQNALVCLTTAGAQADSYSRVPSISADGSCVAFRSLASNLAPGNPIFGPQIYVRDLVAGITTRVSVSSQGAPAVGIGLHTDDPWISADGRFVGFTSEAANLVPGDDNSSSDVFRHDRITGETTRVSVDGSGLQGNGHSLGGGISAGGRFVVFASQATNLAPGDTNGQDDAFVHDQLTSATTRVSVQSTGVQASGSPPDHAYDIYPGPISADGRFVAFSSAHTNLVPGDTNGVFDVFVHDRAAPVPNAYCLPKLDSQGCSPAMSSVGVPSPSGSAPFDILASSAQSGRRGILFYSLGSDRERYQAGVLCIAPPLRRAAFVASGGNVQAHDCSGALSFDFNARIRAGVDPDLVPGTVAYAQYFYRDPSDPAGYGTGISDALRFAIQP